MISGEELVVGGKGGRLGKLGGEGVDPLAHHAGHRVVNLAEVEGDHLAGQLPQLLCGLHGLLVFTLALLPHTLTSPKAAVLDQLEQQSGFSTARRPGHHDPPIGGQVAGQVGDHVLVKPLAANQHRLLLTLRHLEEERFQEPLDRSILGGEEGLGPRQTLGVSVARQSGGTSCCCSP